MALDENTFKNTILTEFQNIGFNLTTDNQRFAEAISRAIIHELTTNAEVYDGKCTNNGPIDKGKIK